VEILNLLASIISKEIKISYPAARGLLKLSIIDEFGPFKSLKEIKFSDMTSVVNDSLKNRLIELNVRDYKKLILILMNELKNNQSLFIIG
jgi:hypothetical protein